MPSEKQLQTRRRLARQVEELEAIVISRLASDRPEISSPAPSISSWARAAAPPGPLPPLDWGKLPASCNPGQIIRPGGTSRPTSDDEKQAARAQRKRLQVCL